MFLLAFVDENAGREVFLGFGTAAIVIFYVLATLAIGLFLWGFHRRLRHYHRCTTPSRVRSRRLLRALVDPAPHRPRAKPTLRTAV